MRPSRRENRRSNATTLASTRRLGEKTFSNGRFIEKIGDCIDVFRGDLRNRGFVESHLDLQASLHQFVEPIGRAATFYPREKL
jgi:hypothetical protein